MNHRKKRKKQRNILLSLLLMAGLFFVSGGREAAADSSPVLEYMYMKEDGQGGQMIIASVGTQESRLEGAELTWETEEGFRSLSAIEVVDGYAAFLLEDQVIEEHQMRELTVIGGGEEHTLDIREFRNAEDTMTEEITQEDEAAAEAELPVAADPDAIKDTLEETVPLRRGNGLNKANGEIVVVLDPGHGGSDSGAYRTWNDVTYWEKEIVLKIARYTKEELEKYAGVKVYLTRESDVAMGLEERVQYAAERGATVFISQHINSTPEYETTATGAEVMVSSGNYRPAQAKETAVIARTILEELVKIGFSNRDLVYKMSETGNTYPNGKLADYYGIVRYCVLSGFPGMIVEHGFVSNPQDCLKYYKTNAKIKKLGVADATAIANYYGLARKSGWNQENGKWYYVSEEGVRMPGGWLDVDNERYYLDGSGYRVTGWQKIGSKKCYFDPLGVMQTGITDIEGQRYLFGEKGGMKKGLQTTPDGNYYYAGRGGALLAGWQTHNGRKYYFSKQTGAARKGWAKLGKYYYYFGEKNARMKKGMVTCEGKTYHLNTEGRRSSGLVAFKGKKWFFSKKTGEMVSQKWIRTGGKWYYLSKFGYALQNRSKVIDGVRYKFDKNGVCINR